MSGVVIRLVVNSFTVVSWSENDARQVPDMSGVEIKLVVNLVHFGGLVWKKKKKMMQGESLTCLVLR